MSKENKIVGVYLSDEALTRSETIEQVGLLYIEFETAEGYRFRVDFREGGLYINCGNGELVVSPRAENAVVVLPVIRRESPIQPQSTAAVASEEGGEGEDASDRYERIQ